jgi:hypothetical protein
VTKTSRDASPCFLIALTFANSDSARPDSTGFRFEPLRLILHFLPLLLKISSLRTSCFMPLLNAAGTVVLPSLAYISIPSLSYCCGRQATEAPPSKLLESLSADESRYSSRAWMLEFHLAILRLPVIKTKNRYPPVRNKLRMASRLERDITSILVLQRAKR